MRMGQAMSARFLAAALPLILAACAPAQAESSAPPPSQWAEACADWDEWDKPGPPFRIHGDSYYVGTCGIAAILITSDSGHILIDSGTEAGADVVLANIRALGFDPKDVRAMLTSHEHFDHVGGMAKMEAATGGEVISSELGAHILAYGVESVMASSAYGIDIPVDPQAGMHEPMQRITQGMPYTSRRAAELLTSFGIVPHLTPGHTPGAMSWQWESCDEAGSCRTIVYADSLSPVSSDTYRFSDHPEYVQAYRDSIDRVAALNCDILLTPHPSASGMRDKLVAGDLASGMTCQEYAASISGRLDARLAEEAAR